MRILDLYCGLKGFSKAFVDRGHEVVTVDIDSKFAPDICMDAMQATRSTFPGQWDAVLAGHPCEAFSVASIGHHWQRTSSGITAKTPEAESMRQLLAHTLQLIQDLAPRCWLIENPRGMMRRMPEMRMVPRTTVTYCQYGETRMKPTDLFGVMPDGFRFRRPCRNGRTCHEAAPRGARTGTQGIATAAERALVPYALSEEICKAIEGSELDPRDQQELFAPARNCA